MCGKMFKEGVVSRQKTIRIQDVFSCKVSSLRELPEACIWILCGKRCEGGATGKAEILEVLDHSFYMSISFSLFLGPTKGLASLALRGMNGLSLGAKGMKKAWLIGRSPIVGGSYFFM